VPHLACRSCDPPLHPGAPENTTVLCADTLAAVVLPRARHTTDRIGYVEKLSPRLFSGGILRFQGCSGLVLVGANLVVRIGGRTSSQPYRVKGTADSNSYPQYPRFQG